MFFNIADAPRLVPYRCYSGLRALVTKYRIHDVTKQFMTYLQALWRHIVRCVGDIERYLFGEDHGKRLSSDLGSVNVKSLFHVLFKPTVLLIV